MKTIKTTATCVAIAALGLALTAAADSPTTKVTVIGGRQMSTSAPSKVITSLASMPLAFTENQGQWDEQVLFRANAGGATMWFTKDGAYYQFTRRMSSTNAGENPPQGVGHPAALAVTAPQLIPCLVISPDSVDYGEMPVYDSATIIYDVVNVNNAIVINVTWQTAYSYYPYHSNEVFKIVSGGGAFTLAPGEHHYTTVQFKPQVDRGYLGSYQINASSPLCSGTWSAILTGTGVERIPCIVINPDSVDYGEVAVEDSATITFDVVNVDNSIVLNLLQYASSPFSIVSGGGAFTLAPGEHHYTTVQFKPTEVRFYSGYFQVGASQVFPCDSGWLAVLVGTGVDTPPGGSIEGRIAYEDGTPISLALVEAIQGALAVGVDVTDDQGYYEIQSLPPETYQVRARVDFSGEPVYNYHNEVTPSEPDVVVAAGSVTPGIDVAFPLPVVLVYGWKGSVSGTWGTARSYFQEDPADPLHKDDGSKAHLCFAADNIDGLGRLRLNADNLKSYIENTVKPAFEPNVPHMNIVAHSMGGVIARKYIHDEGDNIEKLVMLGTPNAGVRLAGLTSLIWFLPIWRPWAGAAAEDLSVRSMITFNRVVTNERNATFYYMAGRYTSRWGEAKPPLSTSEFTCDYPYVCSDGFIGEWSVFKCVPRPDYCVACTDGVNAEHTLLHEHPFINGVLKILENRPYTSPCSPLTCEPCESKITASERVVSNEDELQHMPVIADTVSLGQAKQYEVTVDLSQWVSFYLIWPVGDLDLVLYDPNGFLIDSAAASSDPNVSYKPNDSLLDVFPTEGYEIGNPLPGLWTLEVSAYAALPDTIIPFLLSGTLMNALSMTLVTDKLDYNPQDSVVIQVNVTDGSTPIIGASAFAKVMFPVDGVDSIPLLDDGMHDDSAADDGLYGNRYVNTTNGGRYVIEAAAMGVTGGGSPFARGDFLEFDVSPQTAHFTGFFSDQGIDVDGDTLFDTLRIEVGIEIDSTGTYQIVGSLYDSLGAEIGLASSHTDTMTGAGPYMLQLDFDGTAIRTNGVDGPYYLKYLTLFDESEAILQVDFLGDAYTTFWYSADQFSSEDCCNHDGIRGNVNGDPNDKINVVDVTYLVDNLFRDGPVPPCFEESDVTADGQINVADLTYLVDRLFRDGPLPPPCP